MTETKIINKKMVFVLFLCVIILMSSLLAATFVAATAYRGSGTQADPYLVETAEQLDNIRENLSAHYKLANTIDLSSVANFKPIGTLDTPFKGTFVCDLDESGKPKFAIKNLKIEIAPAGCTKAEGFSGYERNKSGWEAGLFGCGVGATIKNILVLDATVVSKVEGCNMMNSDWTVNPGVDEQGAGILMAIGRNVTITGCGVSGTTTSASNHVGGMLGLLEVSNVSKCYSYATVTSTGAWNSGGFIGRAEATTVTSCFYNGIFSGGLNCAGAFVGDVYNDGQTAGSISNCWSGGTVKTEDSSCFFGNKDYNTDVSSWCYTIAKIEGKTDAPTNAPVKNNNYVCDEIGVFEAGFAVASKEEMNEIFGENEAWVIVEGQYPQLKDVHPVTDASIYQPGAVTEGNMGGNTSSGNTTTIVYGGWVDVGGKWSYYKKATSEWIYDGGKWYHFDAKGFMEANKWMKDSVGWVFLGSDGAMKTNSWVRDSVGWCYVGADGYAVTNCWKKDSVGWCYLNAEGSMTKNKWVKDGGKWYYLNASGYMVANKSMTIGGKKYNFNASGVCTNP